MVCLRFNPKKTATVYEGMREVAAVFVAGRFDQFIETPKDTLRRRHLCAVPRAGKALALKHFKGA